MYKNLIKALKLMDKYLVKYLICILFMSGSMAYFGTISANLLNDLIKSVENDQIYNISNIVIISIIKGLVTVFILRQTAIMYNVEAKRVIATIEKLTYDKSLKLPIEYYETHDRGEFLSRLSHNIAKAGDIYGSKFRRVIAPIISVVVYLVPMILLNWQITILILITNTILLTINMLFNKPMERVSKEIVKVKSEETQSYLSILKGIQVIKMNCIEKVISKKYDEVLLDWGKAQTKRYYISATLEGFNKGFELICSILFLGIGVIFIEKKIITVGELTAIFVLYTSFSQSFLQMGIYIPELIESLTYYDEIVNFLKEDEEYYNKEPISFEKKSEYVVEFKNVNFSYSDNTEVLKNFNIKINSGVSTAITGQSGCGKSTLLKLLLGYYEISSGEILLYGQNIKELGYEQVRSIVAYVSQNPFLFNISIKENIRLGNFKASDEEIILAAKKANAHDFIIAQPQGYDTLVLENGISLSGGEKQRIAIARALLKNSEIIVLDEATAALDNESEILMQKSFNSLMENRTVIMVAHKPTTIEACDVRICL